MTSQVIDDTTPQTHAFEADVAKLLHMMVHSVYSDKDVFLRELISNAADLSLIPLPEGAPAPKAEASDAVSGFIAFVKDTLGTAVSDVRASDRLSDSAVCLVASESGLDRQLEKMLASAGQAPAIVQPVLEVNPAHAQIARLAALPADDGLRADAAHLLLDEARIVDGEQPLDPRAFADRLGRLIARAAG